MFQFLIFKRREGKKIRSLLLLLFVFFSTRSCYFILLLLLELAINPNLNYLDFKDLATTRQIMTVITKLVSLNKKQLHFVFEEYNKKKQIFYMNI